MSIFNVFCPGILLISLRQLSWPKCQIVSQQTRWRSFWAAKKQEIVQRESKTVFFNKQHEKFKSNYILAKAMIVLKNDLTRKNLWSIWHWITKQPHFILNFITNSTSRSWVLRVWWRLFIQYCRWKMLSREN